MIGATGRHDRTAQGSPAGRVSHLLMDEAFAAERFAAYQRAWRHCYDCFGRAPASDGEKAALHLGFFFINWCRTELDAPAFAHDYTIHRPVIDRLMQSCFRQLRDLPVNEALDARPLVLELNRWIGEYYRQFDPALPQEALAASILLATLGCAPSQDDAVLEGIVLENIPIQGGALDLLTAMFEWAIAHDEELGLIQSDLATRGLHLPPMALVDLNFRAVTRRADLMAHAAEDYSLKIVRPSRVPLSPEPSAGGPGSSIIDI